MASYQKTENGKWSVRFRIVENNELVNKRLSGFELKREAETAYREFMASYVAPDTKPSELTLIQLYEQYFNNLKNQLKDSSLIDIETMWKHHINPYLGNSKVNKITKTDILNWQNSLTEKGYSYNYKVKIRICLSAILNFGVCYYDTVRNPVLLVDGFKNTQRKQEMQIWTPEEFKQFISVVDNPIYKSLFTTLFYTGMRKGECLALNWTDFNSKTMKLNVNKSVSRKIYLDKNSTQRYKITTPKNDSSYRAVSITPSVASELDNLKEYCLENRMTGDYIFCGDNPLPDETINRYYKNYCKVAGVKKIRLHDFRHSHASYLISEGINIVAVAKRLGHGDIEQTLNTYSHLLPKSDDEILKTLEKL